ncbi:hypothetical protein CDG60_12355 [Acinetobacter chinensis]|uniref:Uncharacterized protein n=1 Tax=Acinetobacter chinensis TaxID=2004650 RepID=A0A3B7M439_9GAMM|nr:Cro/CI family transcriptional regulator [Acinetobacter chinensis]AXY57289.1 hypothetical protein CDG60_12355 [Acinetobacter chinensis]
MTRNEAIELLNCSLAELATLLGISTAAIAQWNPESIPKLREYEIRDIHKLLTEAHDQNVSHEQAESNV